MSEMCREIAIGVGKVAAAGIIGAAAVIACMVSIFLLPGIVGLLIVEPLSTHGVIHAALSMIVASLATWAFRPSLGSLLLAWILATTLGAVIGGFLGSFLGYLSASIVLHRASPRDDVD